MSFQGHTDNIGRKRQCSHENFPFENSIVTDKRRYLRDSENVINIHMPRLPINNFSEHCKNKINKRTVCSFVENSKCI
jgi:hypothetical protein